MTSSLRALACLLWIGAIAPVLAQAQPADLPPANLPPPGGE